MDRRKLPDPQRLLRARERDRRQWRRHGKLVRIQELHSLSGGEFSRRPAARQHGQAATGTAGDRETLTSRSRSKIKSKWSNADGGGFEPPVPFSTHAFQACTINHSVTHPV